MAAKDGLIERSVFIAMVLLRFFSREFKILTFFFYCMVFWCIYQVHSLEKEISELRALSISDDPHVRIRAVNEIQRKQEEMSELYKEAG